MSFKYKNCHISSELAPLAKFLCKFDHGRTAIAGAEQLSLIEIKSDIDIDESAGTKNTSLKYFAVNNRWKQIGLKRQRALKAFWFAALFKTKTCQLKAKSLDESLLLDD